jgi:hypothetical protein
MNEEIAHRMLFHQKSTSAYFLDITYIMVSSNYPLSWIKYDFKSFKGTKVARQKIRKVSAHVERAV